MGGVGEYKNENYCVFLERNEIKKGKTIFFNWDCSNQFYTACFLSNFILLFWQPN